MLFDTHFHLDLFDNPRSIALSIEQRKIFTIAVTNLPGLYSNTAEICKTLKYVRPALGYHPELVAKYSNQFPQFVELIDKANYVGEVGLDKYKKSDVDYFEQKIMFKKIIDLCAQKKDKIITIHSRKAEKDVIDIIGNHFPGKIILHWYSGSLRELEKALEYDFYFSINFPMTTSASGKKIIEAIPINRLLLETDGPFTNYNQNPCTPEITLHTLEAITKIKGLSEPGSSLLFKNFRSILTSKAFHSTNNINTGF